MNISSEFFTTVNPPTQPLNNATKAGMITSLIYLTSFGINGAIGLAVNSYVIWLICKGKGSGIGPEFISLNLALCEIFFCLGSFTFLPVLKFPILALVACFIVALPFLGRPLFQCLICIERFQAVLYPVSYMKYKPLRYRLVGCAVVWTLVSGFAVFCRLVLAGNDMVLFLIVFLPMYTVLIAVKLYCSLAIYKALKNPKPGQQGKEREEANQMKRKAMKFIMIITASTFFQNSPVCIVGSLHRVLSPTIFDLCWCLSIVNSMILSYVNPALYIYRVKRARQ